MITFAELIKTEPVAQSAESWMMGGYYDDDYFGNIPDEDFAAKQLVSKTFWDWQKPKGDYEPLQINVLFYQDHPVAALITNNRRCHEVLIFDAARFNEIRAWAASFNHPDIKETALSETVPHFFGQEFFIEDNKVQNKTYIWTKEDYLEFQMRHFTVEWEGHPYSWWVETFENAWSHVPSSKGMVTEDDFRAAHEALNSQR